MRSLRLGRPLLTLASVALSSRQCSTTEGGTNDTDRLTTRKTLLRNKKRRLSMDEDDDLLDVTSDALLDGVEESSKSSGQMVEPLIPRRRNVVQGTTPLAPPQEKITKTDASTTAVDGEGDWTLAPSSARSTKNRADDDAADDDDFDDGEDTTSVKDMRKPRDTTAVDPLLQPEGEAHVIDSSDADPASAHNEEVGGDDPVQEYLTHHAQAFDPSINRALQLPLAELVDLINAYKRATENPKVVNANEEDLLFPILVKHVNDCDVTLLLDVVESHWARSTLVRHGTFFKDLVRDRIASDAVKHLLSPEQILRVIVVMGMSAGRRKRDLAFFQVMGKLFASNINSYKEPTDLVRVMTAFARAKIVPPPSFLSLIGRRFPVLCKKNPLPTLPAYRALVNLFKMGHDQMNAFRFLADRIYEAMEENLKKEKIAARTAELLAERQRTTKGQVGEPSDPGVVGSSMSEVASVAPPASLDTINEEQRAAFLLQKEQAMHLDTYVRAKNRLLRITGDLKPQHLTKLLLVLARFGAPHQQYLRPLINPVLVPLVPLLAPPTFSRLLKVIRIFKATDLAIITPVLDHLVSLGPSAVLVPDLLEALKMLALPDVPVPPNLKAFISLCVSVFGDQGRLRATEMCAVAFDLLKIQQKEDIPLEAVESLCGLMDAFADRMVTLLQLNVLSLGHAEALDDMCRQMHHPDKEGKLEELRALRRRINQSEEGDDGYYMALDIDIRETFHKMQIFNHWNTFGAFRPLPGVLQVDLKQALTEVSAECVLETAHLFEQAYPGRMIPTLRRLLERAVLGKLSEEGEEVITEENTIELRPNNEVAFTRETLQKFCNLLMCTPLKRVAATPQVWTLVLKKSKRLQMDSVEAVATQQLGMLIQMHAGGGGGGGNVEQEAAAV